MCGKFVGVAVEEIYSSNDSIGKETILKAVRKSGFEDLLEYRNTYPGKFRMDSRIVKKRMEEISNPIDPNKVPPNFPYTRAIIEASLALCDTPDKFDTLIKEKFEEGFPVILVQPTVDELIKYFEIQEEDIDKYKDKWWFCNDFECRKKEL